MTNELENSYAHYLRRDKMIDLEEGIKFFGILFLFGLVIFIFVFLGLELKKDYDPSPLNMYKETITACLDDNCRVAANNFYKYLSSEVNNYDR